MGSVRIGGREVGDGHPCWVIAEAGINHNGDLATALRLVDAAKAAGADIVKFQTRTPEVCVPRDQWDIQRETPWGVLPYIEYKRRIELPLDAYDAIDRHCRAIGFPWFTSVWDEPALARMYPRYDLPALKIPSACVTDTDMLLAARDTGLRIVMSTGMSTLEEIDRAVAALCPQSFGGVEAGSLLLMHCRSTYPAAYPDLNLASIGTLRERYAVPVGFSDHCAGLWMSLCAVALGAVAIERHLTLDRSSWGADQAASVEPRGLEQLVRQIRHFEAARGDGRIGPTESEAPVRARLRRIP